MNTKLLRWLTAGCLAATTLVAATLAPGSAHPADGPARAAADFSPYITKEGGISLPSDYRDKFMYLGTWAVASKPPSDRGPSLRPSGVGGIATGG